jgi:polyphenol oxidase
LLSEPFKQSNESILLVEEWSHSFPSLTVGFTTKNDGFSESPFKSLNMGLHVDDLEQSVVKNRQKLSDLLNFPLNKWIGAQQTHETTVQWVSKEDAGNGSSEYESALRKTDGLITNQSGILLTMCYADCVPLYFIEPQTKLIGIAHAGWKGSVGNIAGKMVEKFESRGVTPDKIKVVIGPSICKTCYQVNHIVIDEIEKVTSSDQERPYTQVGNDQFQLDLHKLNTQLLLSRGVLKNNIVISTYCSSCEDHLFYSHRRDNGKTGRMMSFIGWKE